MVPLQQRMPPRTVIPVPTTPTCNSGRRPQSRAQYVSAGHNLVLKLVLDNPPGEALLAGPRSWRRSRDSEGSQTGLSIMQEPYKEAVAKQVRLTISSLECMARRSRTPQEPLRSWQTLLSGQSTHRSDLMKTLREPGMVGEAINHWQIWRRSPEATPTLRARHRKLMSRRLICSEASMGLVGHALEAVHGWVACVFKNQGGMTRILEALALGTELGEPSRSATAASGLDGSPGQKVYPSIGASKRAAQRHQLG